MVLHSLVVSDNNEHHRAKELQLSTFLHHHQNRYLNLSISSSTRALPCSLNYRLWQESERMKEFFFLNLIFFMFQRKPTIENSKRLVKR